MGWSVTSLRASADETRRRLEEEARAALDAVGTKARAAVQSVQSAGNDAVDAARAAAGDARERLTSAPPPPSPAAQRSSDQATIDAARNMIVKPGLPRIPRVIPGVGEKGSVAESVRPYVMTGAGTVTGIATGKLGAPGAVAQRGLDMVVDHYGTKADKFDFGYGQMVASVGLAVEGGLLASGGGAAEVGTGGAATPVAVPMVAYGTMEMAVAVSHADGARGLMSSGAPSAPAATSAQANAAPTSTSAATTGATAASAPPAKTIDMDHVIDGGINRRGRVVGYHSKTSTNASVRTVPGTRSAPDANGVYMEGVEALDPKTNTWIRKKSDSTFFPDHYSRADIARSIHEADAVRVPNGEGGWIGRSKDGILIQMHEDASGKITSAYPLLGE